MGLIWSSFFFFVGWIVSAHITMQRQGRLVHHPTLASANAVSMKDQKRLSLLPVPMLVRKMAKLFKSDWGESQCASFFQQIFLLVWTVSICAFELPSPYYTPTLGR
jgi:hypothetical protein